MYVYDLTGWWYSDEQGEKLPHTEYLMHYKSFTQEEFTKICEKILNRRGENGFYSYAYILAEILKKDYGFAELKPNAEFNFDED